ncbi:hypothetical protein F5Y19DRAFT_454566 [Xylariaceae sp. FL1651]|nr:hypothetical protein F5Y19DRAFT_454566 [Xylariaceae sp. FL1651]
MSFAPTPVELAWLLAECEIAISTIRRTVNAYPSDLIAKLALPTLEYSLSHLADDIRGWIEGLNDCPLTTEHYERLCRFVTQSRDSIIHPQASKIGLRLPVLRPTRTAPRSGIRSIVRILGLFVLQNTAFGFLDKFQTHPPWIGNLWVPQIASFVVTYALLLHHQASWIPTLCFIVAQALYVWIGSLAGL